MGQRPSAIIPVPKRVELAEPVRPWPWRFDVSCESDAARAVHHRFESELTGPGVEKSMKLRLAIGSQEPGGYALQMGEAEIICLSADAAGFRHALQTLRQLRTEQAMPVCRIEDAPSLAVRGFHLNLQNCRAIDFDAARHLIEKCAKFKLNTLLVEYGDRFPFREPADLADTAALTTEQVGALTALAVSLGIELIPLQQSLAHLEYLLKHESRAALRERPPKTGLMCPSNPESLALFKSLAKQVMELHPKSRWFHIGGDEARKVGECPICKAAVKRDGLAALVGRYLGDAARWVLEQGKRPIIWDDTLCAFPETLSAIPKETIIAYWDYIAVSDPTPVLIPRMAHAQGGPRVAHDWSWRVTPKRGRVSEVQVDVMKNYSRPVRLKSALGAEYMAEYGSYLGGDFPKWIRALPYLEYYRDKGFDVITCPTAMGNGDTEDGVPNYARFEQNIRTHGQRCKSSGKAMGMITTAWYNVPVEALYQGLVHTAQCAW
jgi:hypothetical protein